MKKTSEELQELLKEYMLLTQLPACKETEDKHIYFYRKNIQPLNELDKERWHNMVMGYVTGFKGGLRDFIDQQVKETFDGILQHLKDERLGREKKDP